MDLDVLGGGMLGRAHEYLLAAHLAPQVSRKGDPVVERMPLRGDDNDRGLGVGFAQVFGARLAGDAVAEDDVPPGHGTGPTHSWGGVGGGARRVNYKVSA